MFPNFPITKIYTHTANALSNRPPPNAARFGQLSDLFSLAAPPDTFFVCVWRDLVCFSLKFNISP